MTEPCSYCGEECFGLCGNIWDKAWKEEIERMRIQNLSIDEQIRELRDLERRFEEKTGKSIWEMIPKLDKAMADYRNKKC